MAAQKRWTIQWHIAADGTVIKQRSRGPEEHQQLFQSFQTSRQPTIDELDALEERLRRSSARGERYSAMLLWSCYAAAAGIVLGIVLSLFGMDAGFLVVISLAYLLIAGMFTGVFLRVSISRYQRNCRDAGLASTGVTLAGREARVMLESKASVSGRKFAAVRA